jgi:hypothetical protein
MKAWHQQILNTREPEQLLQATREYIASLTPEQWAELPVNCRRDRIRGTDDLLYWRDRFTEECLAVARDARGNDTLREMLVFFSAAADRVPG